MSTCRVFALVLYSFIENSFVKIDKFSGDIYIYILKLKCFYKIYCCKLKCILKSASTSPSCQCEIQNLNWIVLTCEHFTLSHLKFLNSSVNDRIRSWPVLRQTSTFSRGLIYYSVSSLFISLKFLMSALIMSVLS